jgi:hypothetical protein
MLSAKTSAYAKSFNCFGDNMFREQCKLWVIAESNRIFQNWIRTSLPLLRGEVSGAQFLSPGVAPTGFEPVSPP